MSLVGMVDDNILIESVEVILVFRTDHLPCGRHRAKG
jgi:hypothetical protein